MNTVIDNDVRGRFNNEIFPNYKKVSVLFHGAVDFPYIRDFIKNKFEHEVDNFAEGLDQNNIARLSTYYKNVLEDGKWMCLRVADHQPNIQLTYYHFHRDLIPSTNPYANICLMFYGKKESELRKHYSVKDILPLRVYREDFERFQSFDYTVYHYIPDIIREDDVLLFEDAIKKWFESQGNEEFVNPLSERECRYHPESQRTISLNPLAQIWYGRVVVELNRNSNNVNEKYIFTTGKVTDMKLADIEIIDKDGNIIDTGSIIYAINKVATFVPELPPEEKKTLDDIVKQAEQDLHKRLKEDLGIYD